MAEITQFPCSETEFWHGIYSICPTLDAGGACYLPTRRTEALKLFEMETLLSVQARVLPEIQPPVHPSVSHAYVPTSYGSFRSYQLMCTGNYCVGFI